MKKIQLVKMVLTNFKGIKHLEFNANGGNAKVYGDNGTGKTTLFDAFVWLLFNKDSLGCGTDKMGIKSLDEDGNVIHMLNHEVEATLLIDGKETTLKKLYKENWTKPRGTIERVFSGHTTKHFINEVPKAKGEYTNAIAEIVSEDAFKLLTNPSAFNDLHWEERRKLLLEITGDVTDEDVIASSKTLEKLLDVLNGNSIEDHKEIIAGKRRKINERIKEIPTRVDEINRNLPDLKGLDNDAITSQIDKLSTEIEEKTNEINTIKLGTATNDLKRKISDIELNIANVTNEHTQNEQQAAFKLKTKLQEEQSNRNILQGEYKTLEQQKQMNEQQIKNFELMMDDLRKEFTASQGKYQEKANIEFNEDECVCPACDQELQPEKIESAKTQFNLNKSKELEEIKDRHAAINKEGKSLSVKVEKLKEDNETLQTKLDKITANGKEVAANIEKLEKDIEKAESTVTPIEENEQYIKLSADKQALQDEIAKLDESVTESVSAVQVEIKALQEKQNSLRDDLSQVNSAKQSKERIAELEAEQKKLAAEFEELEHQLHLTEEFTRAKVNMLTESINDKFKYARFQLFKELVNGGLDEICETTYEGVPYSNGLNNAARVNVGLDIINTLSEHYGVQAPIFIDNAESVTSLIDIDSQIISLVVSEDDKELRVETENDTGKEVA